LDVGGLVNISISIIDSFRNQPIGGVTVFEDTDEFSTYDSHALTRFHTVPSPDAKTGKIFFYLELRLDSSGVLSRVEIYWNEGGRGWLSLHILN
jgi:hypothetical protein